VLIATAGQLAKLNPVLEARGGEQVLADLRRTLRTAVLEESDAILGPKGKRVACSTGASATARWKSCRKHRRCAGSSSGARTPSRRAHARAARPSPRQPSRRASCATSYS